MANPVNPASATTLSGTMTATGQGPASPDQIAQELQQYGSQLGLSQQDIAAANSQLNLLRQSQQPVINMAQAQYEQATGQAGAAEREYTAAMQGPEPNVPIGSQLTRMLLAGARGAFSGEGFKPQETEQQRIDKEREALLSARKDNITRLRDLYTKKADAAQKLGMETDELKARTKADSLTKTLQSMADLAEERSKAKSQRALEEQRFKNEKELARYRAEVIAPRQLSADIARLTTRMRLDPAMKIWSDASLMADQVSAVIEREKKDPKSITGLTDNELIKAFARATDLRTGVKDKEYELASKNAMNWLRTQSTLAARFAGSGQILDAKGRQAIAREILTMRDAARPRYEAAARSIAMQADALGVPRQFLPQLVDYERVFGPLTDTPTMPEVNVNDEGEEGEG